MSTLRILASVMRDIRLTLPSTLAPRRAGRQCCSLLVRIAVIVQLVGLPLAPTAHTAPVAAGAPAAPDDHTPAVEMVSGFVNTYAIAGQVVYWASMPDDCEVRARATIIRRIRTTGWETRRVVYRMPAAGEPCPYRLFSNLVADDTYLYWVDHTGVVRFRIEGSSTSAPETILSAFGGTHSELVLDGTRLFGYSDRSLWRLNTANPSDNASLGFLGNDTARNLQSDGDYLYFIRSPNNTLTRINTAGGGAVLPIAANVNSYVAIGPETVCRVGQPQCVDHRYVYYIQGTQINQVMRYDLDGSHTPIFTSPPEPNTAVHVYGLAAAEPVLSLPGRTKDVFFFEKRRTIGQQASIDRLIRLEWGSGNPEYLYARNTDLSWAASQLTTGDNFVWWREPWPNDPANHNLMRQATDAHALPEINLRWVDFQLTQGIQRPNEDVVLVRNKPTFVRVLAEADGQDVANVTARLTGHWPGGEATITPMTSLITVKDNPPALVNAPLADTFLFQLPLEWTQHANLTLELHLNPFGQPLEPEYDDNLHTTQAYTFSPNPPARFHILQPGYNWNGQYYQAQDYAAIVSWLYRAYPIGREPGQALPTTYSYVDDALGPLVRDWQNAAECRALAENERNECASAYLHSKLAAWRQSGSLPRDAYIYASVVGLPRGSASHTAPVANGPSYLANGWGFELSGFYAGHELGHLLGRPHPDPMSDDPATATVTEGCGHSRSDPNFPYVLGTISGATPDEQNTGFDSRLGVPGLSGAPDGTPRLIRWFDGIGDVMTYCTTPDQWLSPYTYEHIYNFLQTNPSPTTAAGPGTQGPAATLSGDLLQVGGVVAADGSTGGFFYASRTASLAEAPALVPGPHALQLLAADGSLLAAHAFSPAADADGAGSLNFAEVVPFTEGTRALQLVHSATNTVLDSWDVSANAPTVVDVGFGSSPEPLEGTVTISWTGADADGDALAYDLLYSRDAGTTFQILQANVAGTTTDVDTVALPGGSLVFRVQANDGVLTGYADSTPVQLVNKAPQPTILTPPSGTQHQHGVPILLMGYALDAQDGDVNSLDGLTWEAGPVGEALSLVGAGPTLTLDDLATGSNVVRLTATNSLGLSASTDLILTVSDDLNNPPPTLGVAPPQVSLQAEGGVAAALTATVNVFNAGGLGALDWTASSDATWLTLDASSGSGDQALTLTAATDGLAANTTLTATVTITANHAGGQETTQVPVLLQVGAGIIWAPPAPQPLPYRVMIPLVSR